MHYLGMPRPLRIVLSASHKRSAEPKQWRHPQSGGPAPVAEALPVPLPVRTEGTANTQGHRMAIYCAAASHGPVAHSTGRVQKDCCVQYLALLSTARPAQAFQFRALFRRQNQARRFVMNGINHSPHTNVSHGIVIARTIV